MDHWITGSERTSVQNCPNVTHPKWLQQMNPQQDGSTC